MSEDKNDIRLIALNSYVRPDVIETKSKDWVLNGRKNSFYQYIIDRYNGSPTNAAINNSYIDLIYGRGLMNRNSNVVDWLKFKKILNDKELRKIIYDFQLFGEAIFQIIPAKGSNQLPTLYHLPKQLTAPKRKNDDNEVEAYYFCEDWKRPNEDNVEELPIFDSNNPSKVACFPIRPYKAGKIYFSDPDYLAGLQYAELEEEISNYYLSHILNGLSFGYIINIPNGNSYTPEEKTEIERKIKGNLTGSANAGRFIINFNGTEAAVTVTAIEVNNAHEQWQYLTSEARQQLLTAHRVTSPMLFGIKDNTGLGNNANELDVAEAQLMKRIIAPKQQFITDALETIAGALGLALDLAFKPLSEPAEIVPKQVKFSHEHPANELINLGEDSSLYPESDFDLIIENEVDYENDDIELKFAASTGTARPDGYSMQDNKDIVIRYRYVGNPNPERQFCKLMMQANKLYRKEDILAMGEKTVNPGFGMSPNPNAPYSIWLYKGGGLLSDAFPGGTCKHKWNRVIFVRKDVATDVKNTLLETISTSEARRKGFKVPVNENIVSVAPHDIS